MARKSGEDRVLGPYQHGAGWRIIIARSDGRRTPSPVFDSKAKAETAKTKAEEKLAREREGRAITWGQALELFLADMSARECKIGTLITVRGRLSAYLDPLTGGVITSLTESAAKDRFTALTREPSKRGKPYSGAWLRYTLASLRSFGRWLVEVGRLESSPFATIKFRGKIRKGKAKLTLDEARAFTRAAHGLADSEDPAKSEAGILALCCIYLGLRCSEIMGLIRRSVDDGGRRLIVLDSKTDAGKRTLSLPEPIRPYLLRLTVGLGPEDRLFRSRGTPMRDRQVPLCAVRRVCRIAGVPQVCAHSFRGLLADLAVSNGEVLDRVSKTLGHTSVNMTLGHYADRSLVEDQSRAQGADLIRSHGIPGQDQDPTAPVAEKPPQNKP